MNLVRTLLIGLAILMSGCFALLDSGMLKLDTQSTAKFFEDQIRDSRGDQRVLSTIRSILESLLTYHLPAETELQSIDDTMKGEIEHQYNELIDMTDQRERDAIRGGFWKFFHDIDRVENLYKAILQRTDESINESLKRTADSIMQDQHNSLVNYVHQKLFIVILDIYNIAKQQLEPRVQQHVRLSAARLLSKLDMDRLCVTEGIMLSVFLNRPFTDLDDEWNMVDIKERLKFQTMWDGFRLADATKTAITAYMDKTMVSNPAPAEYWHVSHLTHVHQNFVTEITQVLKEADRNGMEESHQRQLLVWTARVWDRLCKPVTPEQKVFKSEVSVEIIDTIHIQSLGGRISDQARRTEMKGSTAR